jgi:hypothetical protein
MAINHDFTDLLSAFFDAEVGALVVGAHEDLVRAKEFAGRPQDLLDLEWLRRAAKSRASERRQLAAVASSRPVWRTAS